jgi:SAM-dependent methyltransferase
MSHGLVMKSSDAENLALAEGTVAVDELNSRFYGKYPFPWPPAFFERLADPTLAAKCLNQSIGSWDDARIAPDGRIWVAGCGTNQAVFTALRFPLATILATDLSGPSLEIASRSARQLGLTNITFERQSINDCDLSEAFDYIICTGVVHHNAQPETALRRLRAALARNGLCELMVYNRYHRVWTTALQKAVQILAGTRPGTDFEPQMRTARQILGSTHSGSMATFVATIKDSAEAAIADICMQPVEHSYTVESLEQLLVTGGLRIAAPCINQFNKMYGENLWYVRFNSPDLKLLYDALPDSRRWQVANLILLERSPLLWFYVQRDDCSRDLQTERQLCDEFLHRRFARVNTSKHVYLRTHDHTYVESGQTHSYPPQHPDATCQALLTEIGRRPEDTVESALRRLNVSRDFPDVNRVRLMLTTCLFPYLVSQPLSAA